MPNRTMGVSAYVLTSHNCVSASAHLNVCLVYLVVAVVVVLLLFTSSHHRRNGRISCSVESNVILCFPDPLSMCRHANAPKRKKSHYNKSSHMIKWEEWKRQRNPQCARSVLRICSMVHVFNANGYQLIWLSMTGCWLTLRHNCSKLIIYELFDEAKRTWVSYLPNTMTWRWM